MEDPEGLLSGLDREFGVLTLDGSHQFFALDGQHRLRAVKYAIKKTPEIGKEDIAILLVPHFDTEEGRRRTRRLFTNINRNAKTTTVAENIALDEDDGFAIVTRQLLNDHPFLSKAGVVKIFMKAPGTDGELKLAGNQISRSDPTAWTTIVTLYDILRHLSFDLPSAMLNPAARPSDEDLEEAAKKLASRIDDLLKTCGSLDKALTSAQSARDIRAPKNDEGKGHPLMRPVIQKAVARAAQLLIEEQKALSWKDFLKGLSDIDWRMEEAPWSSVFIPGRGTIQAGKDFTDLLLQLLLVHLAPTSRQEIKRARKAYRDLKGTMYPTSEDALAANLKAEE
jgi:DNA sulfur modification protein DndB